MFDYVFNHEYTEGASKNIKPNIHTLFAKYVGRSGQLYYKHKSDKGSGVISELLVIRDLAQQQRIVQSVHMGSDDSDTACSNGGHIVIYHTRAKILETLFWIRVAQDVNEFISRCDRYQKVNPVQRQGVAELHPVPVPSDIMVQIGFPKNIVVLWSQWTTFLSYQRHVP